MMIITVAEVFIFQLGLPWVWQLAEASYHSVRPITSYGFSFSSAVHVENYCYQNLVSNKFKHTLY